MKPTIPKALLAAWLEDLRDPGMQDKQAQHSLQVDDEHGHPIGWCCLGRLQMVADGACEWVDQDNDYARLPSDKWMTRHNIGGSFTDLLNPRSIPDMFADFSVDSGITLPMANDSAMFSPAEMAVLVEASVEGV